jgi:hypothetical protein
MSLVFIFLLFMLFLFFLLFIMRRVPKDLLHDALPQKSKKKKNSMRIRKRARRCASAKDQRHGRPQKSSRRCANSSGPELPPAFASAATARNMRSMNQRSHGLSFMTVVLATHPLNLPTPGRPFLLPAVPSSAWLACM